MACITRCIIRWGLIGGLALGGATLLIGQERMSDGFAQIRVKAQNCVDDLVDNPIALRRQLEQLADEYPERIAEVRGEMAGVDHQLALIGKDMDLSKRVVAMTTDDLRQLKTLVAQAEAKQASTTRNVSLRFEGNRFNVDEAYAEASRINHLRVSYKDRFAHDQQQFDFLTEQNARLADILGSLEGEFTSYTTQLQQLDRQIDAIERNERLIELTERQQETLASYDKYNKVANLNQLEAKLAELRTIQEAQLESLSSRGVKDDYIKRAHAEMGMIDAENDPFADIFDNFDNDETDEEASVESIAYSGT
jgi:phage shock protein A